MGKEDKANKQYLQKATEALPHGWRLEEISRGTACGGVTFAVTLHIATFRGCDLAFPVFIWNPRREIRAWVKSVEESGLRGLIAMEHNTYVSRVCYYGDNEFVGLREILLMEDPSLEDVIDSIFRSMEISIPHSLSQKEWDGMSQKDQEEWVVETAQKAGIKFSFRGSKSGLCYFNEPKEGYVKLVLFHEEILPEELPEGALLFHRFFWQKNKK